MRPAPYRGSAPHNGTATSRAAAVLQGQGRRQSNRERVVAFVWQCGARGATREEVADALGMRLSSVCGRVGEELTRRGKNGEDLSRIRQLTTKRVTSAGAQAFVLVAVAPVDARQLGLLGEKGPDDYPRQRTQPQATPQGHGADRRRRSAGPRVLREARGSAAPAPAAPAEPGVVAARLFV